jgi:hypothetical protein
MRVFTAISVSWSPSIRISAEYAMTVPEIVKTCRALWARGTKPTLPEVKPLIDAYYSLNGNSSGGELHVVLDGPNYERRFIRECLARAERVETRWLCHVLLLLSNSQRRRL